MIGSLKLEKTFSNILMYKERKRKVEYKIKSF